MPLPAEIARLLTTPQLPELGPGPRTGVQSESSLNRSLEQVFAQENLPAANQQLVRALVLLWHDHLDAAHTIAQEIENADGAFVHGIMHRREPDYSNAKYWFRRVGQHEAFAEIAKRAAQLMGSKDGAELRDRLIRNGEWDAFAFIDCCEETNRRSASAGRKGVLLEVQAIETKVLLERLQAHGEA